MQNAFNLMNPVNPVASNFTNSDLKNYLPVSSHIEKNNNLSLCHPLPLSRSVSPSLALSPPSLFLGHPLSQVIYSV